MWSGYAAAMSEQPRQDAPRLGDPTDIEALDIDDPGADYDIGGSDDRTIDTPDNLGGTGGQQSGGAG
jgi:hypothetical protein